MFKIINWVCKFMDNKFLAEILSLLNEFLSLQGFVAEGNTVGYFKNDKKSIKIFYDEGKSQFVLQCADFSEDSVKGEYHIISSWLFDESHSSKDTTIIAEDFTLCLSEELGIVKSKVKKSGKVALPSKAELGETPGIEAFTQKFLALFPQYKDEYKNHVALYGEFLYLDFLKKTAVVKLHELAMDKSANKKQLAKYFIMLGEMYTDGDKTVSNVIVGVVIAGAFKDDLSLFESCYEFMDECPYIKNAGRHILALARNNKNFAEALQA